MLEKPDKSTGKLNTERFSVNRKFSVAPMMDWTDRHCRYFHRLLNPNVLLYTEMVTTGALIHGDTERFLRYNQEEHPVAVQLGGSDPAALAECAELAQKHGYDEVNINCGCPSDRVQNGAFGACLMRSPDLVAQSVKAMKSVCDIPITVKCRIGVDDQDEYADLQRFTEAVTEAGVDSLCVHARKAWLKGLSPKENRDVPPLNYERVYQLKKDFSELEITINGGIDQVDAANEHLKHVDGVMMGRAAYHNPWLLIEVDRHIFNAEPQFIDPTSALEAMYPYIQKQLDLGERLSSITRHLLGIYQGRAGTKKFKRYISENAYKADAGLDVVKIAVEQMQTEQRFSVENDAIKAALI